MRKQSNHSAFRQNRHSFLLALFGVLVTVLLSLIVVAALVAPHQGMHAAYGLPYLERQELITDQCSISPEGCLWSNNKPRIVRTSDGTDYVIYVSDGKSGAFNDKVWHLMKRTGNGRWQEIGSGPAGSEPSALLRAPNDDLYVVAFPQNARLDVTHFIKSGSGYTPRTQTIPGFGTTPADATYFGAGINGSGDIVIDQTSWNVPPGTGQFSTAIYWTYYNHLTQKWTYHVSPAGFRPGYLFALAGENQDVQFVGVRDDQRSKIAGAPPGSWALVNEVHDFYTTNAGTQNVTDLPIAREFPKTSSFIIAQSDDAYVDTQGRTHVLYMDIQNGGARHAIIQNGKIIKDVPVPDPNYWWMRIVQDTTGRFYLITMNGGYLTVYPGATGDTDGTRLGAPVNIPLQIPYSDCQAPHLAVPRGGTPLADYVDGFYEAGSCNKLVYFRLRLSGGSTTPPTPTLQPGTPTSNNPPTSYTVYQSGLAAGWAEFTYQSSVNLANKHPVLTGKQSIAWQANAWGTFALANPGTLDITPYGFLHFAAQAGQANSHYAIQLIDVNGQGLSSYLPLARYGGDPVPGRWTIYNIPLTDLKANGKQIEAIGLQNISSNSGQILYLDDVQFLAQSP